MKRSAPGERPVWATRSLRVLLMNCAIWLIASAPAQEPMEHAQHEQSMQAEAASPQSPPSAHGVDPSVPVEAKPGAASMPSPSLPEEGMNMDMGSTQRKGPSVDARDPHAYAEGYDYTDMPGVEKSDQIAFGWVAGDELEFLSGNEGDGYGWNVQGSYGNQRNKLWLRSQGLKVPGDLDPTTGGEALWWRPSSAFWGTLLGVRQDFGAGAHTYLAVGIEGWAPYWFAIGATGYIGDDGRLAARVVSSYEFRLTNRLILMPNAELNAYSKSEDRRNLGAGLGNIELGLRLRYEVHRKFAPYIGYVWERSFAGTAARRRADSEPVAEHRFVAGIRAWW